jgi:general stress protein YciG
MKNHYEIIGSLGGQKDGQATAEKYGHEHFREIGRLGGRGRTPEKRLAKGIDNHI